MKRLRPIEPKISRCDLTSATREVGIDFDNHLSVYRTFQFTLLVSLFSIPTSCKTRAKNITIPWQSGKMRIFF